MRDIIPFLQSAYKHHHSIETSLLKVKSELLLAMNKQQVLFVVLLDMIAACDLIKHTFFEDNVETESGIFER